MSQELLHEARRLIEEPEGLEGIWPGAAALLARQALEEALDGLWADAFPGMQYANRSTQLICLGQVLANHELVMNIRSAWLSLSRACHHHHYELGPTAAELERWIQQTERLVEALRKTDGSVKSGRPVPLHPLHDGTGLGRPSELTD